MTNVPSAIADLNGAQASWAGADPTTEAEYLAGVTLHSGTDPGWAAVSGKLLEIAKAAKIKSAWAYCNALIQTGTVLLQSNTAGTPIDHVWGTDDFSQKVINDKVTRINAGLGDGTITVTPKGELDPVAFTNSEFVAMSDRAESLVDAKVKNYLSIKKAILLSATNADVDGVDITAGY